MTKPLLSTVSALLCLLLAACQGSTGASRVEKITGAYCACTSPLAELNARAADIQRDPPRQAEFSQLLVAMDSAFTTARECAASTVIGPYGKLTPEELREIEAMLATQCPNMANHRDLLRELLGE